MLYMYLYLCKKRRHTVSYIYVYCSSIFSMFASNRLDYYFVCSLFFCPEFFSLVISFFSFLLARKIKFRTINFNLSLCLFVVIYFMYWIRMKIKCFEKYSVWWWIFSFMTLFDTIFSSSIKKIWCDSWEFVFFCVYIEQLSWWLPYYLLIISMYECRFFSLLYWLSYSIFFCSSMSVRSFYHHLMMIAVN